MLKVLRDEGKLVVEGINRVYRHVRRSQKNLQGGRLSKEMPIQISNVMLVCTPAASRRAPAPGFSTDGTKERFCKKCKAAIGQIAPSHAAKK